MSLSTNEKLGRLQRALDYGGPTHRLRDVVEMLNDGRAKLWERGDGVIVTEMHEYPLLRSCHFWLVSGELHDCLALEAEIADWARGEGCTVATAMGRKGWGRAAAPAGWREWSPNFLKRLDQRNIQ